MAKIENPGNPTPSNGGQVVVEGGQVRPAPGGTTGDPTGQVPQPPRDR
jgi:hypothetical protein